MKIARLLFFLPIIILGSCSSEKADDLEPDCTASGLSVTVSSSVKAKCDTPGSFELQASGGEGTLMYSIDGVNFQESSSFASVSAGTYTATVKDANDCLSTVDVTIEAEDGSMTLSVVSTTDAGCGSSNGQIEVSASGGDGSYTYTLDNGSGQNTGMFSSIASGTYTVTAVDGSGCSTSSSATILSGVSLENDIMPIITNRCTVCHKSGGTGPGDFNVKANVIAKSSEILSRTKSGNMPQSGEKLNQDQLDLIECWVGDGSSDN